jgi:hypothetical protein
MEDNMKTFVLLVVLVACLFQTTNVQAFDLFGSHDTVIGSKASSHIEPVKITPHSDIKTVIMQDTTQCKFDTATGTILLCVDTCGGLSEIGTICTME